MGLFSNLFKKPAPVNPPVDFSKINKDMHSHLIPGIDDGAQTMEESLAMLKQFELLGYTKVITTPHVMWDSYKNTTEIITSGLACLEVERKKAGINLEIAAAAEYFLDEHFMQLIEQKDLLTLGQNWVLIEMSFQMEAPHLKTAIFELQMAGYTVVMAHPERYPYWWSSTKHFESLIDRGVLLQVNMNSFTDYYQPQVRQTAEKLANLGWIDLVGSDCHREQHLEVMERTRSSSQLYNLIESGRLKNHLL